MQTLCISVTSVVKMNYYGEHRISASGPTLMRLGYQKQRC